MTVTSVDDIWSYLVAVAVAAQATTLAGVTVQDGPWPAAYVVADPDFLIIGGDYPAGGDLRVTTERTPWPGSNHSFSELTTLPCVAVSQSGDPLMPPRRARSIAITEAVEGLLIADPRLGGLLQEDAVLTVLDVQPVQTTRGAYCAVSFTVGASALIWNG